MVIRLCGTVHHSGLARGPFTDGDRGFLLAVIDYQPFVNTEKKLAEYLVGEVVIMMNGPA
jgi:hypothetical protein